MKIDLPIRKNIRLKEYNYSREGYYFVTICTREKKCILSKIENIRENVGASIARPLVLTPKGKVVEKNLEQIEKIYSNVIIDEYIIMPNHIHLILIINKKRNTNISKIIQQFKGKVTKEIGYSIWQKLFYEHIIQNEIEYLQIKEYIINNPVRWKKDKYFSI